MKLAIKSAAEVAQLEAAAIGKIHENEDAAVVQFINEKVVPEIEARIADPKRFTSSGYVCVQTPSIQGVDVVERVGVILRPLGYSVEKSHDGGGMYETVVVRWTPTKPRSLPSRRAEG